MIKLIKVHIQYLCSYKMIYMMLGIQALFLISCLYFSRFYLPQEQLIFDRTYYKIEYLFETINLLKIITVVFSMLVTINGFIINKYDYFLITKISRKKVVLSKMIVLMGIVTLFVTISFLLLLTIPLYLTPYFSIGIHSSTLFLKMTLFGLLYLSIFTVIYLIFKHILPLFVVFTGYMISFLGNELIPLKENTNAYQKIIHLMFPDVIEYQGVGYDFLYGGLIILSLTASYLCLTILIYNRADI